MKHLKLSVFILMLFVFSVSGGFTAFADDPAGGAAGPESVLDYGAFPDDEVDDTAAFRNAFGSAKGYTGEGQVEITVPAGTYHINDGIPVYSNTYVNVDPNAIIISDCISDSAMIFCVHIDENGQQCYGDTCNHGGYSQIENVTIKGGTWIRSVADPYGDTSIFIFRHGKNIVIGGQEDPYNPGSYINMVCKNASDHFINLSGIDGASVSYVTLQDAQKCTDDTSIFWTSYTGDPDTRYNSIEGIHLDFCNEEGENADRTKPFDNTPSKNITVENCVFTNLCAGVGNHHDPADEQKGSNIRVSDCVFSDIKSYCAYIYSFDNTVIERNTVNGAGGLAVVNDSKDVVIQDNTYDSGSVEALERNAVYLMSDVSADIIGNTISNSCYSGIRLEKNCTVNSKNNIITAPATNGITVNDHSDFVSKGNDQIKQAGTHGIYVENSSAKISSCNIENSSKTAIRGSGSSIEADANILTDQLENGICTSENSSLTASGNTISGGINGIYTNGNAAAVIENNTISGVSNNGIAVKSCNDSRIFKNIISDTGTIGIYIQVSTGVTASENEVSNAGAAALQVSGDDSGNIATAEVTDNILSSSSSYDLKLSSNAVNCSLSGNVFSNYMFYCSPDSSYSGDVDTLGLASIELSADSFVYSGNSITPDVTVKDNKGTVLKEGTDYSLSGRSGKNVGTYTITANGKGALYKGTSVSAVFTITPAPITGGTITVAESRKYTGSNIEVLPTVMVGGIKLARDRDYTVSYSNNKNAGKATVSVEGIGNYQGSLTAYFMIEKINNNVSAADITKTANNKKNQKFPVSAVCLGDAKFSYESSDQNITVSKTGMITVKKKFSGKATITITAKECTNYKQASKKISVIVEPAGVGISKVTNPSSKTVRIKWKKSPGKISGYQIQYSANKKFTKIIKTITVKGVKTVSKDISKLKKKKTYYFRVRTYQKFGGTDHYSAWSGTKSIKIKK